MGAAEPPGCEGGERDGRVYKRQAPYQAVAPEPGGPGRERRGSVHESVDRSVRLLPGPVIGLAGRAEHDDRPGEHGHRRGQAVGADAGAAQDGIHLVKPDAQGTPAARRTPQEPLDRRPLGRCR